MTWYATQFVAAWIAIIAAGLSYAAGPQIGTWGDQGDGTYRNPVLNADYPDADIERRGDTYYMISSKQHMSPGMVILESRDLVNWRSVGHVWDRLSWAPEYDWDRMDGYGYGVWAGDLAWHDGRWYCYHIDYKHGLYVSMTEGADIRGPWTEPHQMLPSSRVMDDPAVFWDADTKQAYLICNTGRKLADHEGSDRGNGKRLFENHIFKMSWDGREILDEGRHVYTGEGAEAAKIYKIDGTWYLFLSEWYRPDPRRPDDPAADRNDRKQIVLRSTTDSIYGPYEKRVVLERGNGVVRSCSQGALIQAPDGAWWYMHQLVQNSASPFQGRVQYLEPVEWIDGWPMIGKDLDDDGVGEPVRRHAKPIHGRPIAAPPTDDDFTAAELGPQWEWNHNPRDSHWSLTERPGWLRLKASVPVGDGDFWGACNTISQRIMGTGAGKAVARFDLSGMEPGQRAGFVRFGGVYHLLGVRVDEHGKRRMFFSANGQTTPGPAVEGDALWVRTTNTGDRARFEFSTDGQDFERIGPTFTIRFGRWTGDRLGMFCWNDRIAAGHIDVDYFYYDYDGPKAARP